jgi:hypothetical protein
MKRIDLLGLESYHVTVATCKQAAGIAVHGHA